MLLAGPFAAALSLVLGPLCAGMWERSVYHRADSVLVPWGYVRQTDPRMAGYFRLQFAGASSVRGAFVVYYRQVVCIQHLYGEPGGERLYAERLALAEQTAARRDRWYESRPPGPGVDAMIPLEHDGWMAMLYARTPGGMKPEFSGQLCSRAVQVSLPYWFLLLLFSP